MGRIKQTYIKRVAKKLLREHPQDFGAAFQDNKVKVGELTTVQGKPIRNKIAGVITRVKRQEVQAE